MTARPRKPMLLLTRSFLLTLLLLITFAAVIPVPISAAIGQSKAELPSKLKQQVKQWVDRLAQQKPFQAWQTADPQIEALGPGTHSWLVLFTKEGKDIGYMVVHAVTDGTFQLGEYGVGPYTLFSPQLLKQSLIDDGFLPDGKAELMTAVKHYAHPFAAAWEVTIGKVTYWFDAKTAEQLPVDGIGWKRMFPEGKPFYNGPPAGLRIVDLNLNETFDAYERLPWLTKEAPFPAKDAAKLRSHLDKKRHLRYVTEPFGEEMLYAEPIIGYQRWSNGRLDLVIDMSGTRFIPVGALLEKGLFYL
ncbi:hypothetical protein [Cohnella luojiensis]|uniref:Uncharacterized protein n=1 Tax=Cohnella luojiensis TaxID=652876 RepID=A0A4Y8M543_9BACL|nr:hypothetical protein [Cohnella luojiensis]TFE27515.1 hypothetical protein E2980_09360 [Cohnella luojiensis]